MRIVRITENDYDKVLSIFKKYANYDYFLTYENEYFVDCLSNYGASFIFSKATTGFFLVNNRNDIIGTILYSIPKKPVLFENRFVDYQGLYIKDYTNKFQLTPIESQILKLEMDVIKNNLFLYQKYKSLILGKSELLLLFIDEKYRGNGLSHSLISAFLNDILINGFSNYFLYTTSLHNFEFFDHLKLQRITKMIYSHETCPNYLIKKIRIPYYGMIYFYDRKKFI